MRVVCTRDCPDIPPALIGQLLDVHADELLVVVQQELDPITSLGIAGTEEGGGGSHCQLSGIREPPCCPKQLDLFDVSPMETASGPAEYLCVADDSARRDEGNMRGGSRCLVAPDAGHRPDADLRQLAEGQQVAEVRPVDVVDPVSDRGMSFAQAAEMAEHRRLTLTCIGDVYTLSSPVFGLAHFESLAAAVSAVRQYARTCDLIAEATQQLGNPNPHWRPRA